MLEFSELPELVFDFAQQWCGQPPQKPAEATIVDGSTLVNHDFAWLRIACNSLGQRDAQQILPDESRRAGQYPRRRMPSAIEKIRLDD